MMAMMRHAFLFCVLVGAIPAAELRLAHLFQDHMVLQADLPVPIWGWAEPGSTVQVRFATQEQSATGDDSGRWEVRLAAMPSDGRGQTLEVRCGDATLVRQDVVVGEVWLCTGQSNMARDLRTEAGQYPPLAARLGDHDLPQIRFIRYPQAPSDTPREEIDPVTQGNAAWTVCSPETAPSSMASPYFFARRLHAELGVPVGLIQVAVSGTTQTAWCAPEVLDACAAANPRDSITYAAALRQAEAALTRNKSTFPNWDAFRAADQAWRANPVGRRPLDMTIANFPGVLYHSQIHPLAPFVFRGAMWNQGEGGPMEAYGSRLHAMVTQWRQRFGHDFHFLVSSLGRSTTATPPLQPDVALFYRSAVNAQLRAAQQAFADSGTWVDIADLGNTDTHWGQKDVAGHRYADAALARVYGKPRAFSGPLLDTVEHQAGRIQLRFTRTDGGLVYAPSIDGISGFVLEVDGAKHWLAPSAVTDDTLTFADERITADAQLAYGYHPNPHETLHNGAGYPASMFRIGSGNVPMSSKSPSFLRLTAKSPAKLHIAQVRAQSVVVSAVQSRGKGEVDVSFQAPKDWAGLRLVQGNRDEIVPLTTGTDDMRSAVLKLTINAEPVVLCDTAADPSAVDAARTAAKERF